MSDTVPDVAPDMTAPPVPTPRKKAKEASPTVGSPTSFFPLLLITFGYLFAIALSWQAIVLMFGSRMTETTLKVGFYLWMIPVLAVFFTFFHPSLAATTGWVAVITPLTVLPVFLAFGYVLLFGIRTSQPV
jgi:hypothetical protein